MAEADLVIRGGMVVDGSGGAPYLADVAVQNGRILAVGPNLPPGREEIAAQGLIVTPGFVDVHTHYDAQATFSPRLDSSSLNGVTTVLIGNCGVGFAPCTPANRDALVELMEGVEDLPEVVLNEGLPWNWESFPSYLDALAARQFDCDVVTQVTHAALRLHVMGDRAVAHADSTPADRAEMARLAAEGIKAGAIGFSTSRAMFHKTLAGVPTPTYGAPEAELAQIGAAAGAAGAAWLQVISDFDDPDAEFAMLQRISSHAKTPLTFSLLQRESRPWLWKSMLDHVERARAEGITMMGQVMGRPVGLMFGWELSQHPFVARPSYAAIAHLPLNERLAALRDPALRTRIISEPTADPALATRLNNWDRIFKLGAQPEYEPHPSTSVAAEAARLGVDAQGLCYDWMMEQDGKAILNRPLINYADGDLEAVRAMLEHPMTLIGLGDGGAHVGYICDASCMTHMLAHWTRDRSRGPKLPLEFAVKRITRDNALAIGLPDRGLIAPGLKADINVIDYARLGMDVPEMRYDLPAGGKRLVQGARGYVATVQSGQVVYREGIATGALPGRLVRGGTH